MSLSDPGFFITFSLIQLIVLLLLIRAVDLYEREPLSLVAFMAFWGATGAVAIGLAGNEFLSRHLVASAELDRVFGSALSAPIIEEFGKGVALVAMFFMSRWTARRFGTIRLDGVTDGIVYGAAIGIGFAFTENIFYFMRFVQAPGGLYNALGVFSTRLGFLGLSSLGHAVYTGAFGAALGLATWSRSRRGRIGFPLLGFLVAVVMHATYNGLAQLILVLRFDLDKVNAYYASGAGLGGVPCPSGFETVCAADADASRIVDALDRVFLIAFFAVIAAWLAYQRRVIREELTESAEAGLFTTKEAEVLPRYWRRSRWYAHVILRGGVDRWRLLRTTHAHMVDLALTKRRLRRTGPGEHWKRVDDLWNRIRALRRASAAP